MRSTSRRRPAEASRSAEHFRQMVTGRMYDVAMSTAFRLPPVTQSAQTNSRAGIRCGAVGCAIAVILFAHCSLRAADAPATKPTTAPLTSNPKVNTLLEYLE